MRFLFRKKKLHVGVFDFYKGSTSKKKRKEKRRKEKN